MSRLLLPVLLLTSCAAEVAPRAEPGDPRVMPVGATAALDGSFSEGDGLSYAWSVEPADGATLTDPGSPFATFTADAPGLYTLRLEVCDAEGRCDVAETWARVDDLPGSTSRVSDWAPDEFGGAESGAGAPLGVFKATTSWCKTCLEMAEGSDSEWNNFCNNGLPAGADKSDIAKCKENTLQSVNMRKGYCWARGCHQ